MRIVYDIDDFFHHKYKKIWGVYIWGVSLDKKYNKVEYSNYNLHRVIHREELYDYRYE